LVGDAYIHGVIRGEGLDSLDGGIRDVVLIQQLFMDNFADVMEMEMELTIR
jgi:hypothetical protein